MQYGKWLRNFNIKIISPPAAYFELLYYLRGLGEENWKHDIMETQEILHKKFQATAGA